AGQPRSARAERGNGLDEAVGDATRPASRCQCCRCNAPGSFLPGSVGRERSARFARPPRLAFGTKFLADAGAATSARGQWLRRANKQLPVVGAIATARVAPQSPD